MDLMIIFLPMQNTWQKDLPHQADTYCQNRKDWLRSEDIKIGLFVDLGSRDLPLK